MINYEIVTLRPKQLFMQVRYSTEGQPDFYKNFSPEQFTEERIQQVIQFGAIAAQKHWDAISSQPDVPPPVTETGTAYKVIQEPQPVYDNQEQRIEPTETVDEATKTITKSWVVIDLTVEEKVGIKQSVTARQQNSADKIRKAQALLTLKTLDPATLTDEEFKDIAILYPAWVVGSDYTVDDIVFYDDATWICIQAHTSQGDWAPDLVPALFNRYREPTTGPQEWIANEAVATGDQRTYQGTTYEVIQSHTTQAGWEPPNVPALWSEVV